MGMALNFEPVRVDSLLHTKIIQIACGQDYTLLLDHNGHVYSHGVGGKTGVLGHGSLYKRLNQPVLMETFGTETNTKVHSIHTGWKHAAAFVEKL